VKPSPPQRGGESISVVEGETLVIESRYADGDYDRLQALGAELASLKVDVIFANSAPAALAAKRTTTSIPIVLETLGDSVQRWPGLASRPTRVESNGNLLDWVPN
jgi:putative ABC transport system substrate-binding protein